MNKKSFPKMENNKNQKPDFYIVVTLYYRQSSVINKMTHYFRITNTCHTKWVTNTQNMHKMHKGLNSKDN